MHDGEGMPPRIWLDPGEIFIGTQPAEVHTLLGSCVAVTLYSPRLRLGAICHGRLPARVCDFPLCGTKVCQEMGHYVDCAMRFMLYHFDQKGSTRRELEVKLFGGARMFDLVPAGAHEDPLGKRNVDAAMAVIRRERLHLLTSDVGGIQGRTLVFHSATGDVLLKRTRNLMVQDSAPTLGQCPS